MGKVLVEILEEQEEIRCAKVTKLSKKLANLEFFDSSEDINPPPTI